MAILFMCNTVRFICYTLHSILDSVKKCYLLNRVQLSVTPWTIAHQGLLSMGFPRQEYWNGLPFPSPGDLPDMGIDFTI